MLYKFVGDSCSDLTQRQKADPHYHIVPLTLQLGSYKVIDDENFNREDFLKRVENSPEGAKTACPSPELFKKAYEGDEEYVFVVTLSEHLSGTYQSAVLGKKLYEEEHGENKKIMIINSLSAAAGQTRIFLELEKMIAEGVGFEEIEERITKFIKRMKTYFVLETLETLRKNGRLSGLSAFFATKLNIKPVMGAENGKIVKCDQARGINKALNRMVELTVKAAQEDSEPKTVVISVVQNKERGEYVAKLFQDSGKFKEVILTEAAGVTTVYACDGGIVIGMG